jgi:hypothetical protein
MTDTLDFVKNLWGSMHIPGTGLPGMPGMATPPMSTDDLDKRIADLKAVESWLNLNLTMLRGTIQALEVQRGTLATLKSMGASMAEAMRQSGVSAEKMAGMPFAPFFAAPTQGSNAGAKPPAAKPGAPAPEQPGTTTPLPSGAADAQGNPAAMAMPAAVAWWNMLQEQFTQAVASAMAPAASVAPAADGGRDLPKAEAPKETPKAGSAAPIGNGKTPRAGRTKTDKS